MMIKGAWYSDTELEAYIATLENKNERLEEKHLNECRQISEYEAENKKLKELVGKLSEANGTLCFTLGECGGCDLCPLNKPEACDNDVLHEECVKVIGGQE